MTPSPMPPQSLPAFSVTDLEQDLLLVSFEPTEGRIYGLNLTVLLDGHDALLIDAGYEPEMEALKHLLSAQGLRIKGVIISHYHEDHMQGLRGLPGIPSWGSAQFKASLDLWTPQQDHPIFTPTHPIEERQVLRHGRFSLDLIPFPGHSPCTLLTCINGIYLHVADEVMLTQEGRPLLPFVDGSPRHRHSLERLEAWLDHPFIPSHGPVLLDRDQRKTDLAHRQRYVSALMTASPGQSLADTTRGCTQTFAGGEWHAGNLRRVLASRP